MITSDELADFLKAGVASSNALVPRLGYVGDTVSSNDITYLVLIALVAIFALALVAIVALVRRFFVGCVCELSAQNHASRLVDQRD